MGDAGSGASHRRDKPPRPSTPRSRPPLGGGRPRRTRPPAPPAAPVSVPVPVPPSTPSRPARRRAAEIGFWVGLALGTLLVGGYLGLALLSGGTLPKGASVAGVAVGGLSPTAAETLVRKDLATEASATITVTGGPVTSTVDPRRAGLSLDVPASVRRAAGGGRFAPARVWRELFGGHDVDAVAATDRTDLAVQVARVAAEIRQPVVHGAIGFDRGKAVPVAPANGRAVSVGDVRTAVLHGFLRTAPVRVPVEVVRPKVGATAVAEAMSRYAVPLTSGPVELVLGDDDVVAAPDLFTTAITLRRDGGRLEPRLDVDRLFVALEPLMGSVAGAARPAEIAVDGDTPRVVPSKKGVTFDRDDLRSKFLAAALAAKGQRRVTVKGVTSQPSFTTADARAMNVTERLATVTSDFGFADYRNTNIARGAELLDGTVVRPGETFSFDDTIGKPSDKNGFTPGYELQGGMFRPDRGAGLSQLASAVYAASYDVGLKDAGHSVTAVHSDRYPLGREVGVEYPTQDLRFTNDTANGVLIKASTTPSSPSGPGSVTVSLWSTRTWDVRVKVGRTYALVVPKVLRKRGRSCEAVVGTAGFSVDVTRVFRKPGEAAVDHRDRTTTTYPVADSVSCA